MQFKQKLIYFALGCAFVVIAQVLLSIVVPKETAQGKKTSAEFDTVKVRKLEVLDDSGRMRILLECPAEPSRDDVNQSDTVMQVFNRAGVSVYQVDVNVHDGGVDILLCQGNGRKAVIIDAGSPPFGAVPTYGMLVIFQSDGTLCDVFPSIEFKIK